MNRRRDKPACQRPLPKVSRGGPPTAYASLLKACQRPTGGLPPAYQRYGFTRMVSVANPCWPVVLRTVTEAE